MSTMPEQNTAVVPHPAGHRGTLWTADGEGLPVQTYEREHEVVLVVLTEIAEPPVGEESDVDHVVEPPPAETTDGHRARQISLSQKPGQDGGRRSSHVTA